MLELIEDVKVGSILRNSLAGRDRLTLLAQLVRGIELKHLLLVERRLIHHHAVLT